MAEMYLVTLSQASGNPTDLQRWALNGITNRGQYLGEVTLHYQTGSWGDLQQIIRTVVQLYQAMGHDSYLLEGLLKDKLKEAEAQYSEEAVANARKVWEAQDEFLCDKANATEVAYEDSPMPLRQRPVRLFPNRK